MYRERRITQAQFFPSKFSIFTPKNLADIWLKFVQQNLVKRLFLVSLLQHIQDESVTKVLPEFRFFWPEVQIFFDYQFFIL